MQRKHNTRRQDCYQEGKERAQSYPICLSGGYAVVSGSIWQLQGQAHWVLLGSLVAGHLLALGGLQFIFLTVHSSCWQNILSAFFFYQSPLWSLPTAVSGISSQQNMFLSQSLLNWLFSCVEDQVMFILPNNNSQRKLRASHLQRPLSMWVVNKRN